MGIPNHLTCLLRNLYAGQEATVRAGHETTDWFTIGKGVCQGCILSPYVFNLYAEYIMRNARLDEAPAGIKTARRNINNIRSLMAEIEEELKSLLKKVKEENEKAGLNLKIKKTKIMASGLITSRQIDGETSEIVTGFIFLGSKILRIVTAAMKLKRLAPWKKSYYIKKAETSLPTKVHLVKAVVFPLVMFGYESWTIKKAEHQRIDAFKPRC